MFPVLGSMHWLLQFQRSRNLLACQIFDPFLLLPHLSRIAEEILVRRWLFPCIPIANVIDQYAFKPSGSTTAALIHFTDKLTKMLETNNYVGCLMIDFSKAFDTVDHVLLLCLINWFSYISLLIL